MKCAMFVSCNIQYISYLNALLNSIEKRKANKRLPFDVIVLTDGSIPKNYIKECEGFSFNVYFEKIDYNKAGLDASWGSAWKCKAGRYYYISTMGMNYDVCCLMDADLFLVTDQFVDFFGLVNGTKNLIGCNERIKWQISDIYKLDNKPILSKPQRLNKFHCNVPLFIDVKYWQEVFKDYLKIVFRGKEYREKEKVIGDLYSWNLAIYRNNRQDDVILMNMQSMTQVHRTGYRDKNCALNVVNGYWTTGDGDQVYCIHGRPDKPGFRAIEQKKEFQKHGVDGNVFKKYAKIVEDEFADLNKNYVINLEKYKNG